MEECIICRESAGQLVAVTERGKVSLIDFAKLRENEEVLNVLAGEEQHYVHETCRKWFNNRKRIASEKKNSEVESKKKKAGTRNSLNYFDWKKNCFLCGDCIHEKRKDWHAAQTLTIRETILKNCETRLTQIPEDLWTLEVKGRVNDCVDFVAAEARYHQYCRAVFSSG